MHDNNIVVILNRNSLEHLPVIAVPDPLLVDQWGFPRGKQHQHTDTYVSLMDSGKT
jgi:hypothetical protein